MSDQENQNPAPPRPTIKTSAVPLKKETVRITLRAQSPEAADAPATPPTAPVPPPAAVAPPPMAAPPPRPVAPTVPLSAPPRPGVPGAPPAPAPRPGAPPAPVGSKTIPLSQAPARPTTPMVGKQTTKIVGGAPTTQPLPRATVKLQPTSAAAAPVSNVSVRSAAIDDDEEMDEGPLNIMGWVALVASIAALIGVLACMDKIEFFAEQPPSDARTAWLKGAEPDGFKLPMDYSPFDKKNDAGGVVSTYASEQPDIPQLPPAP